MPAKKPLSHARWAGENGAVRNTKGTQHVVRTAHRGGNHRRHGYRLFQTELLQFFDGVSADKLLKCFVRRGPVLQVGPQHPLDDAGSIRGDHVAIDLPADLLLFGRSRRR